MPTRLDRWIRSKLFTRTARTPRRNVPLAAQSRLERLERDEIVRCLTRPDTTVTRAAEELGIGRATLYRKIAQYKITVPRATG